MNQKQLQKKGTLYIVATPIGNLDDISFRAVSTLKNVDIILTEDTRTSSFLLNHYQIKKKLISYHHYNENERIKQIEAWLNEGNHIALISDAGTPLISDPGYIIVNYLRENDFDVVPIPGPSATIAAISASGLESDCFQFIGFLPVKEKQKEQALESIKNYNGTTIIYEAPHRILQTLFSIKKILGNERLLVLAKELTKQFESFVLGNADEIIGWLEEDSLRQKGEFVLLIQKNKLDDKDKNNTKLDETLSLLLEDLPLKKAVKLSCHLLNLKKNQVYERALELQKLIKNKD